MGLGRMLGSGEMQFQKTSITSSSYFVSVACVWWRFSVASRLILHHVHRSKLVDARDGGLIESESTGGF